MPLKKTVGAAAPTVDLRNQSLDGSKPVAL